VTQSVSNAVDERADRSRESALTKLAHPVSDRVKKMARARGWLVSGPGLAATTDARREAAQRDPVVSAQAGVELGRAARKS
jgi:ABC-type Zn uptake system ZnuABC Zn-binding protein ZnuA